MAARHVIVGAGPAGLHALATLRALDPEAAITLVCDEPAYARMVLPYYLGGAIEERAVRTADEAWFEERGVETRLGSRVVRVDPGRHRIELGDGGALAYDKLLLATGARVAKPAIDGAEVDGVVPMWTLEHARGFLARSHRETVIVGAGFIAFTILDAVARRSERVRLLEIEPQILPRMLDAAAAGMLRGRLEERGIEVRTDARLERIEPSPEGCRLALAGGDALACDAVILATGIQPNVEFLEGSGIEIRHGILVDERMRTSAPDVYAAGDVAEGPDLLGDEHSIRAVQPVAVDHGRIAAAAMAGVDVAYAGSLAMNILAAQGLEACSFGRWGETGDATVVENPANRIYRKYVWEGDVLVGGILVGPSVAVAGVNDVGMLKGLIQTGVALGPWRAYLEENPLDLRRPYVASGAAAKLLGSTLLAGRPASGGGFRFPAVEPVRGRSPHHGVLVSGAPR